MDERDLKTIFALCAALSMATAGVAALVDFDWAIRFAIFAAIGLANFWALAQTISGVVLKNKVSKMVGLIAMPLPAAALLVYGKIAGIELTSFLAGFNMFFVSVFAYLAYRSLTARPAELSPDNNA